ncbi:unnamed protein product [Meloidogyne enterolobii]|uniref:Uncharacterized protein n=1 Tax=Meloidogyne enterolobii TaxID=390850 RepID=A0ACB0Z8L4_MELEN
MLKIKKRIKNEEEELKEIRRHPRLDNSINNKNNRVDNYLIKQQNRVGKINKLKEENEGFLLEKNKFSLLNFSWKTSPFNN